MSKMGHWKVIPPPASEPSLTLPWCGVYFIAEDSGGYEGAMITNQSGGYACNHPKMRGFARLVGGEELERALSGHFTGEKWCGWCCDGIDLETAQWMDVQLLPYGIRIDRDKLGQSMEAWVYAKTIDGLPGVLAWPNSD